MVEHLDEKEILARNPHIDPNGLAGAREMLRRFREMGLGRKGYDIVPPFGGRRVGAHDDDEVNSGLIRSKRARDVG